MAVIDLYKNFPSGQYGFFQKYYWAALAACVESSDAKGVVLRHRSIQRPASIAWRQDCLVNRLRKTNRGWACRIAGGIEVLSRHLLAAAPPGKAFHPHVGQYFMHGEGAIIQRAGFLIDANDKPEVMSPELLTWGRVYFKSNLWPGRRKYPDKVRPIVRGSDLVPSNLDRLRALRRQRKEWDLVFVYKVWGGREHNIRLYEALAKAPGRKLLKAIIVPPAGGVDEETRRLVTRLEKAGVAWSCTPLPVEAYWDLCARSRLVVGRVGKYLSIPFSVTEFLSMGACFTLDHDPYPQWPVPLRHGHNYLGLGIRRPEDTSVGPDEDYAKVADTMATYLKDSDMQEQIRANNESYFEAHASPRAVGRYIVDTMKAVVAQES